MKKPECDGGRTASYPRSGLPRLDLLALSHGPQLVRVRTGIHELRELSLRIREQRFGGVKLELVRPKQNTSRGQPRSKEAAEGCEVLTTFPAERTKILS